MARPGAVCRVSDEYGSGVLSHTSHGYCFSPTKMICRIVFRPRIFLKWFLHLCHLGTCVFHYGARHVSGINSWITQKKISKSMTDFDRFVENAAANCEDHAALFCFFGQCEGFAQFESQIFVTSRGKNVNTQLHLTPQQQLCSIHYVKKFKEPSGSVASCRHSTPPHPKTSVT